VTPRRPGKQHDAVFSPAFFVEGLPARTDANTYANRADTDAYARAIATTIVAGATVVAGCIATPITTLNDHASTATSTVAATNLVADQSNIFDVVID
jgi:hypothetical protein